MPDGDKKKKKLTDTQMWNAYGLARKWQREGVSVVEIDTRLRLGAGIGLSQLQKDLGIAGQQKAKPEDFSRMERLKGSARAIKQGLTSNWSDEIEGGISGAVKSLTGKGLSGEGYGAREQYRNERFAQAFPGSAKLGGLAGIGALASLTAPLGAGAAPARAAAQAGAAGAAENAAAGAGAMRALPHMVGDMLSSGARGLATGAAWGGAMTAGAGEGGPVERAKQALPGMAFGGAAGLGLGLLTPPVAAGIGRWVPGLLESMPGGIGQGGANAMRTWNPTATKMASNEITATLDRAGVAATPEAIAQRMAALPERMIVADIDPAIGAQASDATRRNLQYLARANGPARAAVARSEGAGSRLAQAVRESAGVGPRRLEPSEVFSAKEAIWKEKLLNPLLERSGGEPVGSTQMGQLLKEHPIIAEFLRHQEGVGEMAANPAHQKATVNQIWQTRKNMQAKLKDIYANPGKTTWQPETLKSAIAALDDVAEQMHPGLGETINVYRQINDEMRSREAGRALVNASGDEIRAALAKQNTPEKAAFLREGLIDELEKKLTQTYGDLSRTGRSMLDLGGDDLQRLRYLYPEGQAGDAAFGALVKYLGNEGMISETTRQLATSINAPLSPEGAMNVGYITTQRALANDVLRQVLEDPATEAVAASHSGRFFLSHGPEAARQLRNLHGAVQDAAAARTAGARAAGVLGEQFAPDQRKPLNLLGY